MQKTKLAVNWIEDKQPMQPGIYFVAARYQTGFGAYEVINWDGKK